MSWCTLLLAALLSSSVALACEDSLLPASIAPTQDFIAYLEFLSEHALIGIHELEDLQQASWPKPTTSAQAIHAAIIQDYLEEGSLDWTTLREWISARRAALGQRDEQRGDVRIDTVRDARPLEFRPLTDTFEMMTTTVTEDMWERRMGRKLAEDFDGDLPAAGVSWYSAAAFANRVSLERGLEPFYDFEGIDWESNTSAEDGTLMPKRGGEAYRFWRKAYQDRGGRSGEGCRLPSYNEWLYAIRSYVRVDRQTGPARYDMLAPLPGRGKLTDWGAFLENAGSGLRHVGEDGVMVVGGHEFFGLIGNLWQWVDGPGRNGTKSEKQIYTFETVGGDRGRKIDNVISFSSSYDGRSGPKVGFRLVRGRLFR